ncbi:t-SNARE [Neocallimastix californiae]|uniref:t-SNARE n=1 Tax=Neocallimastix californiae TaxID=1754190 RepID=A0A1Y2AYY2_9FUNG|nr:t-SNARE [Neocallimastix californiae]|eukprot:ORY27696.1 t-SNARE [Neocallimastix californiae]
MAVRDRLLELEYSDEGSSETLFEIDIDDRRADYDTLFFNKINQLKSNINECYKNVNLIKNLQKKVLINMFKENEIAKTNNIIDDMINTTNSKVQFIINEIKGLNYENSRMNLTESEVLMRKSQQKIIMNKVKEFIKNFTLIQHDYEQRLQERIIRQHNIVNPNEDFTINKNIDRHTQIFANELLSSSLDGKKKQYNEAQTVYQNMKSIERSISDLYMLSKEIQIMLDSQNEKIYDIGIKVEDAEFQVEEGNEQLSTAIEKGKSIRNIYKYISFVISITSVLIIIYLAVIFM